MIVQPNNGELAVSYLSKSHCVEDDISNRKYDFIQNSQQRYSDYQQQPLFTMEYPSQALTERSTLRPSTPKIFTENSPTQSKYLQALYKNQRQSENNDNTSRLSHTQHNIDTERENTYESYKPKESKFYQNEEQEQQLYSQFKSQSNQLVSHVQTGQNSLYSAKTTNILINVPREECFTARAVKPDLKLLQKNKPKAPEFRHTYETPKKQNSYKVLHGFQEISDHKHTPKQDLKLQQQKQDNTKKGVPKEIFKTSWMEDEHQAKLAYNLPYRQNQGSRVMNNDIYSSYNSNQHNSPYLNVFGSENKPSINYSKSNNMFNGQSQIIYENSNEQKSNKISLAASRHYRKPSIGDVVQQKRIEYDGLDTSYQLNNKQSQQYSTNSHEFNSSDILARVTDNKPKYR